MERFEMLARQELVETAGLFLQGMKEFAKNPGAADPQLVALQCSGFSSLVRYYQALGSHQTLHFAIARTVLDDEALKQHYLETSTPDFPGVKRLEAEKK